MKNTLKFNLKEKNGITLIALVITTIVHYVERLNAVISRVECI